MKAFRFRLQAVLTLREQAEQVAQQSCARAYEALESAASRLRAAESAVSAAYRLRTAQLEIGARADHLEQVRGYVLLLEEQRQILSGELADAQRVADHARQELVCARQRRESLEKLRARQRRAQESVAARAEQGMLDDVAQRGAAMLEAWREATADL